MAPRKITPPVEMRILYWSQLYWPSVGGVEVLAADFIRHMRARGFDFVVVTSHGHHPLPDRDEHEGVEIHRFPFLGALQARDLDGIVRAVDAVAELKRKVRPDLVHIQFSDPTGYFHLRSARAYPAPTLLSLHVAPPSKAPPGTVFADLLQAADWVTANSAAIADDLLHLVPALESRLSVIHPGALPPRVTPSDLRFDPPVLLCLGRLVEDKGFDLALDALPAILDAVPEARLVVAGDGAARAALEVQARSLGVAPAVDFTGWIPPDEVHALIDRATIVIVPSRWREAFGVVALQAAQMGRPVVCTDTGGLVEVVEDGRTGLVVPREDAGAIAAAVLRLLRHPEEARRFGAQARAHASTDFSWDRQLDLYEALYRRWAPRSGGGRERP